MSQKVGLLAMSFPSRQGIAPNVRIHSLFMFLFIVQCLCVCMQGFNLLCATHFALCSLLLVNGGQEMFFEPPRPPPK